MVECDDSAGRPGSCFEGQLESILAELEVSLGGIIYSFSVFLLKCKVSTAYRLILYCHCGGIAMQI